LANSPSANAHARNIRAAARPLASPETSSITRTRRSRLRGNRGPTYVRAYSAASARVRTVTSRARRRGGSNTKSAALTRDGKSLFRNPQPANALSRRSGRAAANRARPACRAQEKPRREAGAKGNERGCVPEFPQGTDLSLSASKAVAKSAERKKKPRSERGLKFRRSEHSERVSWPWPIRGRYVVILQRFSNFSSGRYLPSDVSGFLAAQGLRSQMVGEPLRLVPVYSAVAPPRTIPPPQRNRRSSHREPLDSGVEPGALSVFLMMWRAANRSPKREPRPEAIKAGSREPSLVRGDSPLDEGSAFGNTVGAPEVPNAVPHGISGTK
jgi:hypothetical protein